MSILFIFIQNNSPQKRLKRLPPNLWYKVRLNRQWNCWSLSCSWSIACRRCTNYIFVLDLIPGFNGLEFGASYIRGLTVRASIIIKPCIVYSFQYPMSCKVTLNRKYGHKFRFWLYQNLSFSERPLFLWHFPHWLHRKLLKWHPPCNQWRKYHLIKMAFSFQWI